jgi:hypothetical protein
LSSCWSSLHKVLRQHEQPKRVCWKGLEVQALVKPTGTVVLRVHDKRAYPSELGEPYSKQGGLAHEFCAQPRAAKSQIHREACQEQDWNGMTSQPFLKSLRRLRVLNGSGADGVVTGDNALPHAT